jgi:hypothetical protein
MPFGKRMSVAEFKKLKNTKVLNLKESAKGNKYAQVNGITVAILAKDIDMSQPLEVVELITDGEDEIFYCIYNPSEMTDIGTL